MQRSFLDHGQPLAQLLAEADRRGIYPRQVRRLLLAFAEAGAHVRPVDTASHSAGEPLLEPLTEREHELLVLLVAGLTNREIAEQLVISTNTVRTHLKNVYGKLNVRNRVEAASRARELGLSG